MRIVRDPSSANTVENPEIRELIQKLFKEICDGEQFDPDLHGFMVLVEPGDTVEALEDATGCAILTDPINGTRFGQHPEFRPAFDFADEHIGCYRLDYALNDAFGVAILVPKVVGINSELLRLCETYAEPVHEEVVVTQP